MERQNTSTFIQSKTHPQNHSTSAFRAPHTHLLTHTHTNALIHSHTHSYTHTYTHTLTGLCKTTLTEKNSLMHSTYIHIYSTCLCKNIYIYIYIHSIHGSEAPISDTLRQTNSLTLTHTHTHTH